MEAYLKITYLNDFIFCPLSIYYHELYGSQEPLMYHDKSQLAGKAAHVSIDTGTYSTHSEILQGMSVYSNKLNICGVIDIFDVKRRLLTERKKKIVRIYDGYVFQLYAQYYCLLEMGYTIDWLRFHSKDDNKLYPVLLPKDDPEMNRKFLDTLYAIQNFSPEFYVPDNCQKCRNCIYSNFCDRPKYD